MVISSQFPQQGGERRPAAFRRDLAMPVPGVTEPTVMIKSEGKERTGSSSGEIKVLLVEDNPGDVGLMRASMEDSLYHKAVTLHADRLQKAVEMVLSEQPDVILLDLGLPDSSGLDTVDRMVKAAGPIPIVVLTGYSDENLGLEGDNNWLPTDQRSAHQPFCAYLSCRPPS